MRRAIVALAAMLAVGATPSPTPPPQIYRVVTRPLCSELHEHVAQSIGRFLQSGAGPAIGMDLETVRVHEVDVGSACEGVRRRGEAKFGPPVVGIEEMQPSARRRQRRSCRR